MLVTIVRHGQCCAFPIHITDCVLGGAEGRGSLELSGEDSGDRGRGGAEGGAIEGGGGRGGGVRWWMSVGGVGAKGRGKE